MCVCYLSIYRGKLGATLKITRRSAYIKHARYAWGFSVFFVIRVAHQADGFESAPKTDELLRSKTGGTDLPRPMMSELPSIPGASGCMAFEHKQQRVRVHVQSHRAEKTDRGTNTIK